MSIKPVGIIRVDVDGAELRLSEELPKGKVSLYYIPDTHRVVPVEPDLKHHNSLESMILSHTDVWRELLLTEKRESRRDHQEKYWQHEIDALDSIVSALRLAILAAAKEPATCSVCGLKRSDTKNCNAPDCSPILAAKEKQS